MTFYRINVAFSFSGNELHHRQERNNTDALLERRVRFAAAPAAPNSHHRDTTEQRQPTDADTHGDHGPGLRHIHLGGGELEAVAAQTVLAYANPNGAGTNSVTVVSSGNGGPGASGVPPSSPKETLQVSTIATGRVGLNVPVPPSMGSNSSINVLNNNNGTVAMDGGATAAGGKW